MLRADAKPAFLDLLYDLKTKGFPLNGHWLTTLEEFGYIENKKAFVPSNATIYGRSVKKYIRPPLKFKNPAERAADKKVTIIDLSHAAPELISATQKELNATNYAVSENLRKSGLVTYEGRLNYYDWKIPKAELFAHTKEFFTWISSINRGFQYIGYYWRYNLYMQQYNEWMSEKTTYQDFDTYEGRYEFIKRERERCNINSLYFLDRYFVYKSAKSPTGFAQYKSQEAQRVITFLIDSGYNLLLGKARQIWATTTMFGIALKRVMMNKSYISMILTSDTKKAERTFDEKVKSPYYGLPFYIKPSKPSNDTKLSFTFWKDKAAQEGASSTFTIENATATAVNAASPNDVFIDEIGLIDDLVELINEIFPTMSQFNADTGKLESRGQLVAWGTSDVSNHPAFEGFYRGAIEAWDRKEFSFGLVPVFLNAFARAGMTQTEYDSTHARYYAITGSKQEQSRIQFHQSFPLTIDDMFVRNSQTLIPYDEINRALKRILEAPKPMVCQFGWFEPIIDSTIISADKFADVGYKIVGSNFVPASEQEDPRVSSIIFQHPNFEERWVQRYYKGTDPISNSSGHSKFASAILDNLTSTISCVVNFRVTEHRYCYLQSLLAGIYYDPKIPELVESNIGQTYIDYLEGKGFMGNLVPNMMLPHHLQTPTGNNVGINKRGNTARFILNELVKYLELHKDNVWIYEFFRQLKTYVRNETTTNPEGSFKVDDPRINYDDVIDAVTYAYICQQCYSHISPRNLDDNPAKRVRYRYRLDRDYNMHLVEELV